jgi:riboflavin kinase / FMN adenylyltransferase
MQQFIDIATAQHSGPTYLTIGNFDGLHLGHQALLRQLQAAAGAEQTRPVPPQTGLVIFDPHPLAVLRPDQPLLLLTTPQERLTLAAGLGIDLGVIQTFTPELARLDARAFVTLLVERLGMVGLVVGPDFALGHKRSGTLDQLQLLGEELGYRLHVVEPVAQGATAVRSSVIRSALQTGDVQTAAALLGRPYPVTGIVVEGDRRGRQLGIPTANLSTPPAKLLPANGVYVTRSQVTQGAEVKAYASVTNLGTRPTVDGVAQRLETHLLDFPAPGQSDDLYGQTLRVEFLARLRGEERFPDLAALVAQIHADIAQARTYFQQLPPPLSG